jgi:hypothetical protein
MLQSPRQQGQVRAVTLIIIWHRILCAIWHMVRKTKGADWYDRPGFLVGICTEGRFGSLPAATAPPRTAKALEASGPRCGHCIPDGPASNVSFARDRLGYLRSESLHRHRRNSSARLPALLSVSVAERTDESISLLCAKALAGQNIGGRR